MKRRNFLTLIVGALALPFAGKAHAFNTKVWTKGGAMKITTYTCDFSDGLGMRPAFAITKVSEDLLEKVSVVHD